MELSHLLGFLCMAARKKVTLLLAAQRSSLGLAALGVASSWSRAAGNFSVGFAEIEPECDSRVNGDTPAHRCLSVFPESASFQLELETKIKDEV